MDPLKTSQPSAPLPRFSCSAWRIRNGAMAMDHLPRNRSGKHVGGRNNYINYISYIYINYINYMYIWLYIYNYHFSKSSRTLIISIISKSYIVIMMFFFNYIWFWFWTIHHSSVLQTSAAFISATGFTVGGSVPAAAPGATVMPQRSYSNWCRSYDLLRTSHTPAHVCMHVYI